MNKITLEDIVREFSRYNFRHTNDIGGEADPYWAEASLAYCDAVVALAMEKLRQNVADNMDTFRTLAHTPPWSFTGEKCPKCRGNMISNRVAIECGEMHCDYVEHRK